MIVIGVDTHKRSHTLVALEAGTGMLRGQLTFPASDDGALDALRFTAVLDDERVWAIEDCRHVSGQTRSTRPRSPAPRCAHGLEHLRADL